MASQCSAVGFLTRESLPEIGLPDHASVYLPQSYNFAGQMLVVPRRLVAPIEAPGADVMACVVSGGAAEIRASRPSKV